MSANVNFSKYQQAVFLWISEGRGNAFIKAVAGSGKTTTIIQCAKLVFGVGLFLAFNKTIANELTDRLAGTSMVAGTIHSQGFAVLKNGLKIKRPKIDARKCDADLQNELNLAQVNKGEQGDFHKVLELCRVNLAHDCNAGQVIVRSDHVAEICQHYGIALDLDYDRCAEIFTRVLNIGIMKAKSGIIDFTDMIWLPVVLDLSSRTKYDWIFVDESQDLNKCQLALVQKFGKRGSRFLFVGDPGQAIYGFAGADSESVSRIVDTMKCKVLPLSVCYRCPKSVITEAKQYMPNIEASETAEDGSIETMDVNKIHEQVKEGDMVLCRVNAPLVRLVFKLIANKIPAIIRGRDIAKQLETIVKLIDKKTKGDYSQFGNALKEHEAQHVDKLVKAKAADTTIDAFCDRITCVRVFMIHSDAKSAKDLIASIDELFSDERGSVTLSSVHKAKGLESDNVYIACPEKMPHPMAKLAWEKDQEKNLQYVAVTRARKRLVWAEGEIEGLDVAEQA